jgi:hypothetical protein
MWSFLLGSAVGYIALNTGPLLRKGLAWAIVNSESGLETLGKEARRIGGRMAEDVEDILAEAAAQREAERLRQVGQVATPTESAL